MPNITTAAHSILTGRIATSWFDGKLPRGGRFRKVWNIRGVWLVYTSMATAVLLLTVFVGAVAVRILGVSSIDLLDDDKR
ncbi:MAG TPA: hypothetical protein VGH63_16860 [Polyangia bacterium]|jgi:hypothetical protein